MDFMQKFILLFLMVCFIAMPADAATRKFGVSQKMLTDYIGGHPDFNFHPAIDELFEEQAKQIHRYFWQNSRIREVKNDQIATEIFYLHSKMGDEEVDVISNHAVNRFYGWDNRFQAPLGSVAMLDMLNGIEEKDVPRFLLFLKSKDAAQKDAVSETQSVSTRKHGISQKMLTEYVMGYPNSGFPVSISGLSSDQAAEVEVYFWRNQRIAEINNQKISRKLLELHFIYENDEIEKMINQAINAHFKFCNFYEGHEFRRRPAFNASFGSVATVDMLNRIKDEKADQFLKFFSGMFRRDI